MRFSVAVLVCLFAGLVSYKTFTGRLDIQRDDSSRNFMAGWQALGTCTAPDDIAGTNRDSVLSHLRVMRRHGLNTVREPAAADGRIVARGVRKGDYNWYGYTYRDAAGIERRAGHPRPGAYVEGMRWLLDAAYGDEGQPHISVIVSLPGFVTPNYKSRPYGGSDILSCSTYRRFIEEEKDAYLDSRGAAIPPVRCSPNLTPRPFWEWNIWYIVTSLKDHPGLRGWFLWDEPEGITFRHLFGAPSGTPRPFVGAESLPTTDLLRYVHRLIKDFDGGRHPTIVDIHSPHVFFSDRFEWSVVPDSAWSSGPFDLTPSGEFDTPADILGLEASSKIAYPGPASGLERMKWFTDPNVISITSTMLADAAERDGKRAMVIAAQAQLPSHGPFALDEPLRCGPNDQMRTRVLNDRDLIWELLTTHIDGLYGYIYYSHALMPYRGLGAEQTMRSYRLLDQFMNARLDSVFAQPELTGRAQRGNIHVHALTDYYTSPPSVTDSIEAHRVFSRSIEATVDAREYRVSVFNRSDAERNYGESEVDETSYILSPDHELLRLSVRSWRGYDYIIASNAYDAAIAAEIEYHTDAESIDISEGHFDLGRNGEFHWSTSSGVDAIQGNPWILTLDLEPYEARILRIN